MDLLWSLGLMVVILLALNHMAGGNPANVLRPATGLVTGGIRFAVRLVTGLLGSAFKIGAGSIKITKQRSDKENDRGPGPPPPRWDD